MDTRKDYVAPAIAAEDALEQTSLACNMTSAVFTLRQECLAQANQKNGGFWSGLCDAPVYAGGLDGVAPCEPAPYPDAFGVAQQLVLGTAYS